MKPFYKILMNDVCDEQWRTIDTKILLKQIKNNSEFIEDYLKTLHDVSFSVALQTRQEALRYSKQIGYYHRITDEIEQKNYFLDEVSKEKFQNYWQIIESELESQKQSSNTKDLFFHTLFGEYYSTKILSDGVWTFSHTPAYNKIVNYFISKLSIQSFVRDKNRKLFNSVIHRDNLIFIGEAVEKIKNNKLNWKTENLSDSDKLRIFLTLPDALILSSDDLQQSREIVKSTIQTLMNSDATIEDKLKRTFKWNLTHSNNLFGNKKDVIHTIELLKKYGITDINPFFEEILIHHNLTLTQQG